MNIGDLIVHIGAKPNGYRIRMACAFISSLDFLNPYSHEIIDREMVLFTDGRQDWKDQWRGFKGWKKEDY